MRLAAAAATIAACVLVSVAVSETSPASSPHRSSIVGGNVFDAALAPAISGKQTGRTKPGGAPGGNDSCRWANDGECDDPDIGTGACILGTVSVGDRFAVVLDSPRSLSPEYEYSWGDPVVSGPAVAYVETQVRPPPPDIDGGVNKNMFVFEAKAAGKSSIRIPRKNAGAEAPPGDHSIAIVVK